MDMTRPMGGSFKVFLGWVFRKRFPRPKAHRPDARRLVPEGCFSRPDKVVLCGLKDLLTFVIFIQTTGGV